jgi:hypothetical protein
MHLVPTYTLLGNYVSVSWVSVPWLYHNTRSSDLLRVLMTTDTC